MCEVKPGCRCANDTRGAATATLERYAATHPDGPAVDPLSAATATVSQAAPAQHPAEDRVAVAEAELAAAEARHADVAREATDKIQRATAARDRISELEVEATRLETEARSDGQCAMSKAYLLYSEHDVNPRLIRYYIADMNEAAGLSRGVVGNRHEDTHLLHNGRPIRMKVKRNGPDAGPTRAAAEAAKTDPEFQASVAKFEASRAQAKETYQAVQREQAENQHVLDDGDRAERAVEYARRDVDDARTRLREAKVAAGRARARAAAGAPVEGQESRIGPHLADDIYVAPDGTTNVWRYQQAVHDTPEYYEQLRVQPSARDPRRVHLVTPDGFKVRRTTHYRNYSYETHASEVWVGKPPAGARPAREVGAVVLESSIDSGD